MNATARREAILQKLAASSEPVSASALAGQLGISRASLYRAVTALEEAGIIRRASRKEWIIHFPVPEKGGGMPENK